MSRLEMVRKIVDGVLRSQPDEEERRCGFVHLYGVSQTASILAQKRGLDVELSAVSGMLHDISSYRTKYTPDHGRLSAADAEKILFEALAFATDEIKIICEAIRYHSEKHLVHGPYAELLKDADVFQHYVYNTTLELPENNKARLAKILSELSLNRGNQTGW